MASSQIEKIVKLYKTLAQNPSLNSAKILRVAENEISIMGGWSQRNLERKMNQKFSQNYILDSTLRLLFEHFPTDITAELSSAFTEDAQQRAVLRQATVDNTTKQFIEIWDKQKLIKNYDLAAIDVHGDVYTDSEFSSFEWSPDKKKIVYIAEKKLPKSKPFYKQKSLNTKDEEKKEETESVGNEYVYLPHWGEQLVGKHKPVVVVLDTTKDNISAVSNIPDELSPGQVLWMKDNEGIIGVAWKHEPRHLGLIACTNRLSWIFLWKDGEFKKLSSDGCAVRCPRLSPDGRFLIWLEREAGGAHQNAHRLMHLDLQSEKQKASILVDIVPTSIAIKNSKQFYGLYGRLPRRCWSNDSQYIFLSTPQQNNIRSYVVDIKAKTITEIQNDKSSLTILDVKDDVIAFSQTSLLDPSDLIVGRFHPEVVDSGIIPKNKILSSETIPGSENLMYEICDYDYNNDDEIKHFNFIYFGPKSGDNKSVPLIIAAHGGPHSNYANQFALDYYLFVLSGFAVVQVNYRGSTGMGSKNVEYLQGKVGDVDVRDCVTATNEALKKYPWLNPDQIGITGGSHGGFLVTHLSGQHPDLYKVVVARNPVIDIAAMFTISDIPDWCAAEVNYPFDESTPMPESEQVEMLVKMFKCSPIIHVNKVRAPTLLCIGSNDLRVPPSQGKLWYQRLKANNVTTKLLLYEDNHPLASGPVEIDNVINACLWLHKYISTEKFEGINSQD
ncbi:acylamino-acid-releasing enzyme [Nomia melanderi]|uniref:acylamino-acid-releasing enzyme n=1 Tax=Nomia melanderi TaxID=2448451 RepID=UPI00130429B3|nr:acylamino-acid-releasing enzyme-like [Nomia melanderi]XP_031836708.1 acylamino-acid-releasing enzyme-like [Nomia melanderi]XP_031836717.1 acylamino-acid-releasing enzyme-like [Nomia melanderi]XP_031836726.1 acylamino-acid-releasing enzyme-like [Nomia melanderi]XP_031836736.1 acylamino-acid-releasing enzyme-like [Nomia melanderi]